MCHLSSTIMTNNRVLLPHSHASHTKSLGRKRIIGKITFHLFLKYILPRRILHVHHVLNYSSFTRYSCVCGIIFIYITKRRFVSKISGLGLASSSDRMNLDSVICTQRVTAGQLRLLGIFSSQFVSDAVEKLHIALLGVFLEGCHECP